MPAPRAGSLKLDLLPPQVRRRGWIKWAAVISAIAIGIELAVILSIDVRWGRQIGQLKSQKSRLEREKVEVDKRLADAQAIRGAVKAIEDRLSRLEDILKTGERWVEGCQRLSKWIPSGVQITSLQIRSNSVRMQGFARDRETWKKFCDTITRSALFTNVRVTQLNIREPFNLSLSAGASAFGGAGGMGMMPGMAGEMGMEGGMPGMAGMPGMPGMPGMAPMEGTQETATSQGAVSRWIDYEPIGAVEFTIEATLAEAIKVPTVAPPAGAGIGGMAPMPGMGGPAGPMPGAEMAPGESAGPAETGEMPMAGGEMGPEAMEGGPSEGAGESGEMMGAEQPPGE